MGERRRREPRPRIDRVYAESRLRTAGDDMPAHHWHPYYEMFYVETGACSYMVENEIYDLHMGDFLLIPPHTFHYTRYRFGPCRRAAVFFRAEDVGAAVRQVLPGQEAFLSRVQILQAPEAYQAKVEALLDVLVDGPFVQAQYDISLRFRGSANQRLLDMPKTLAAGRPVLWEDKPVFSTHTMD